MSKFFKTDEERNLWIKLNAERIAYKSKVRHGIDKPLGKIEETYSPMSQSNNQLIYDETTQSELRFTLDELLLPEEELFHLCNNRYERILREIIDETNPADELFPEH